MSEVWLIFAHLAGGAFAIVGVATLVAAIVGAYIDFDWEDYE